MTSLAPTHLGSGTSQIPGAYNEGRIIASSNVVGILLTVMAIAWSLFFGTQVIAAENPKRVVSRAQIPAEHATYRYDLVMSEDAKVCKHMSEVYNRNFARPFDYRGFSDEERLHSMPPLESKYPTSQEFEAVPWRYPKIFTDDGAKHYPLPVAEFDVDNDGKKDTVVKITFFSTPSGPSDEFLVLNDTKLDLTKTITRSQLITKRPNKEVPHIVAAGALMRIFILNGLSYFSVYNFSCPDSPVEKCWMYQPPETMEVMRYEGGGVETFQETKKIAMERICKFNMSRINN